MLIPWFKLNYLPENDQHLKKLLLAQAVSGLDKRTTVTSTITHNDEQSVSQAASASQSDDDDLFQFVQCNANTEAAQRGRTVDQEVDLYVNSVDTNMSLLLKFPRLCKAFLMYNAALPSGAAVERLFSCAGQISVPRRCRVSDAMFEKLVFLRYKLKWHTRYKTIQSDRLTMKQLLCGMCAHGQTVFVG